MPKENINTEDGRISVGWTPEQDVQVGVECVPVAAWSNLPPEVTVTAAGPSWATLNRDGINRLIRALRKARDAAFGADA